MRKLFATAALSAILAISGCATPSTRTNPHDTAAVAAGISVQHDNFKKITTYTGPNAAKDFLDQLFIRAWKKDATGDTTYQIYVADYYDSEWRFYNTAYDSDGARLKTLVISRDTKSCNRYGCSHQEHIGLDITRNYLEQHQDAGIHFKLSGKAGEEVFHIPGSYVRAILQTLK